MSVNPGTSPAGSKADRPIASTESSGSGFLRQMVILIAIILTFCTAAFAVVWAMASQGVNKANSDRQLVELLQAGEKADQAFATELAFRISPNPMPDGLEKTVDDITAELGVAAKAFGVDNLKLTDSAADEQIRSLLTDPTQRLADSRTDLETGHLPDPVNLATFENMQLALRELANKAPNLMRSPSLVHPAQAYAEMAITTNPWPLSATPQPDNDPRLVTLNTLVDAEQNNRDRASTAPTIFMWVAISLAVLAAGAWALLMMGKKTWAKAPPKGQKAPKPPKQPKTPKEPKERKAKAPKEPKAPKDKTPKDLAEPKALVKEEAPAAAAPKPDAPVTKPSPLGGSGFKSATPAAPPAKTSPLGGSGFKSATPAASPAKTSPLGASGLKPATPAVPETKPGTPSGPSTKPASPPSFGAAAKPAASPAKPSDTAKPTADAPAKPADKTDKPSGPRIPWRTTGDSSKN